MPHCFALHGNLPARSPGPVTAPAPLLTTPFTATASFASEFQEGNEPAQTVGGKLEVETGNPRGSDLVFQPHGLLNWLLRLLDWALLGISLFLPQTPGDSHHGSLYPFPQSY